MQATGVHVCWISVVVIKYNQIKLQYICKEQFFHILAVPVFASDVSGVQTVLCLLQKDKIYWSWWDKYDIISTWIAKKKLLRSHPLNFHLGAYPLLNLFPEIIQNCNSSILFTPYTITSVCTFFTLFAIHFLRSFILVTLMFDSGMTLFGEIGCYMYVHVVIVRD